MVGVESQPQGVCGGDAMPCAPCLPAELLLADSIAEKISLWDEQVDHITRPHLIHSSIDLVKNTLQRPLINTHTHLPIMCPHVDDIPLDKSNAVAIETDSPHIPMPNGNSNVESSSSSKDASTLPPAAKPVHQQQKKNAYGPRYSDFLSNTSNWSVSRFSFPLLTKSTSGEREFSGGAREKGLTNILSTSFTLLFPPPYWIIPCYMVLLLIYDLFFDSTLAVLSLNWRENPGSRTWRNFPWRGKCGASIFFDDNNQITPSSRRQSSSAVLYRPPTTLHISYSTSDRINLRYAKLS